MLRFAPALAALTLALACTPAPSSAPPPSTAPAKPTATSPPAVDPARAQELALARDLEIERLYRAVRPYRRGGVVGIAYLDGVMPASPPQAAAAEWTRAAERLRGRFGDLRPLTPLTVDLAADPDLAGADPATLLRRAAAMQGLDYVLIYRLSAPVAARRGWFGGATETPSASQAEAAILDVRTGSILGSVTARPDAKAGAEGDPRGQATAALIAELETLGRRLDADAMRAAGPPM